MTSILARFSLLARGLVFFAVPLAPNAVLADPLLTPLGAYYQELESRLVGEGRLRQDRGGPPDRRR